MIRILTLAAIGLTLTGCGLIDSDITRFDMRVSNKSFTVDSAAWSLTSDERFPQVDCTQQAGVCSVAVAEACGNDALCFGSCDGTNCRALVLVAESATVDLSTERPELQTVAKQPIINVSVERVFYDITENTLNIATPELKIYVAPAGVVLPGDPQAKLVGSIQPIPAGATPSNMDVVFTPDGELLMQEFMGDWKNQFNVLVGAEISIEADALIPTGKMTAEITVDAFADL